MNRHGDTGTLGSDAAYRLACDCIERDYEFVLTVDSEDGHIVQILGTRLSDIIKAGDGYSQASEKLIRRGIIPGDVGSLREDADFERVKRELSNKPSYMLRFTGEDLDGELRSRELNFRYPDYSDSEICVSCQDVSERIREEKLQNHKLSAALNEAMRASEAKSEFLSRMSHDMRTPLNGVIGMTELALEEADFEKAREYMSEAALSGNFLLGLINDVLEMARIENGKIELHPEPYGNLEFLEHIRALATPLCKAKNQSFVIQSDGFDRVLLADKLRLDQIFFNLISNASKYTPEGGTVRFTSRSYKTGRSPQDKMIGLRIDVSDNGVGISRQYLEHIFEPFSREETGASAQTQGTGLGLAIVRSLVDIMHGRIKIESEPGKGTCVSVMLLLPLAPEEKAAGHDGEIEIETKGEKEKEKDKDKDITCESAIAGKRVLCVDDNHTNVMLMQILLKKRGVITECAESGRDALQMFMENERGYYDAIFMDVRMPVMDGIEVTKAIRGLTRPDAESVPIIAVTANAFDSDVKACLGAGMNAHVSKPVEAEKLFSVLEKYCL